MMGLLASCALCMNPPQHSAGEFSYAKRIQAHLLVGDCSGAVAEARQALRECPQSSLVRKAYIQALSIKGEELDALSEWTKLCSANDAFASDRKLLELLAWGALAKGHISSQLSIRVSALVGSSFTRDVLALPLLLNELRSSNALVRSVAIQLAISYGDAPLKEEIVRLLKEERVWYVRLAAIKAAGEMRLHETKSLLKEIVASPRTLAEEKIAAIIALVTMYDAIARNELLALVRSDRAGLRQLGSEVIARLHLKSEMDLLLPLIEDSSPDVRISALNTLALLQIRDVQGTLTAELIESHLEDPSAEVAMTTAYLLMIQGDKRGEKALLQWISHATPKWRRLASAALAAGGRHGLAAVRQGFKETSDVYVRVNLAYGLIGQRVEIPLACKAIRDALHEQALWMWQESGTLLFRSLSPSHLRPIDAIANYPAVIDQMVRLELLALLSVLGDAGAPQAVREFLQTKSWGVTGTAAAILLQEGTEEDLAAVRTLLADPDEKIRLQAALILATMGKDPSVVHVLQEVYNQVDREMKIHILEALGHVGDPASIPFLVDVLKQPFQTLRVIAASALIQCLYH